MTGRHARPMTVMDRNRESILYELGIDMRGNPLFEPLFEYQWGVFYEGRDVGYIAYDSEMEARHAALHVDDKHAPARLVRRRVGPLEYVVSPPDFSDI